jgi:glutaconate CoA-transferase subunit B
MAAYNSMELMICIASRELEDGATLAVGTGAPCAAAMLAQKTHSPNLSILFEAGSVGPLLPEMPISVGDSRASHKAVMATTMGDIMESCARGCIDYAFLGGAQIDRYGNLNSTIIGTEYSRPRVRLPGSGGANDFGSFCWKTIILTVQDDRRFVEKCDFVTTPGWLQGGKSRDEAGLPPGTGPYRVFTDKAVMDFEPKSKRMRVISVNPEYSMKDVQDNCGFELLKVSRLKETQPPTEAELRILREEVGPHQYVIGRYFF